MAVRISSELRLYVGAFDLGTATTSSAVTLEATPLDKTAFGDAAESSIPGLRKDAIEWAGWFDDGTGTGGGINQLLGTLLGSSGAAYSLYIGTTNGDRAYCGTIFVASVKPAGNVAELVKVVAMFKPDGTIEAGKHFGPRKVVSTSGTTDDSAATTSGGAFYSHVFGWVGTPTTGTMVLQHSTDGTIWADVGTHNYQGPSGSSQRTTFSGTLRRYVRLTTSAAGSNNGAAAYVRTKD